MGYLPALIQHGQDKELNLRQATLEVCEERCYIYMYMILYNNQISVCTVIGQSAMVYCASKLIEKSCVY